MLAIKPPVEKPLSLMKVFQSGVGEVSEYRAKLVRGVVVVVSYEWMFI